MAMMNNPSSFAVTPPAGGIPPAQQMGGIPPAQSAAGMPPPPASPFSVFAQQPMGGFGQPVVGQPIGTSGTGVPAPGMSAWGDPSQTLSPEQRAGLMLAAGGGPTFNQQPGGFGQQPQFGQQIQQLLGQFGMPSQPPMEGPQQSMGGQQPMSSTLQDMLQLGGQLTSGQPMGVPQMQQLLGQFGMPSQPPKGPGAPGMSPIFAPPPTASPQQPAITAQLRAGATRMTPQQLQQQAVQLRQQAVQRQQQAVRLQQQAAQIRQRLQPTAPSNLGGLPQNLLQGIQQQNNPGYK